MSDVCKKLYPHEDPESLNKFYGDPHGRNGGVSASWYKENIVFYQPAYPIFFSVNGQRLTRFAVHKKCLKSFETAFGKVAKLWTPEQIQSRRVNICGGVYGYRLERGGNKLSTHSWGIAIDMDPENNPFPKKWNAKKGINQEFVAIMEKHGFWWRGEDGDIDPMHFQCAWR